MNDVRTMHHSEYLRQLCDVQSRLHLLRGANLAPVGNLPHRANGMHSTAQGLTQGVDGLGPQRSRDTALVQERPSDWFGRGHGVRQPELAEIHLSQAEVMHGIRHGLIALETK